jgi:hypothetical protein
VLTRRYSAAVWLAIYVALQVGARFLHLPPKVPAALVLLLALLSYSLFIFIALAICASITYRVRSIALAALMLVIGATGWWVMLRLGLARSPAAALAQHMAIELFRILAAVGLGTMFACAIRERNILLPAAVFAAFADYFMVRYGTVHVALKTEAGQQVVRAMSAEVPRLHASLPVLTIGMADFVFLAFFFACVYRFELNLKATYAALFVLLTASLLFVSRVGPIPALAPMALAFVAVNFRRFKLSRTELQAMTTAAVIVLILALSFIWFTRT